MHLIFVSVASFVAFGMLTWPVHGSESDDPVSISVCEAPWPEVITIISYIFDDARVSDPSSVPNCPVTIQVSDISRAELKNLLMTRYGLAIRSSNDQATVIRVPPTPERMCVVARDRCPR